ncbi:hypothetical protein SODALDRAFT_279081, partial [Sodiomyces alkalinus F11]
PVYSPNLNPIENLWKLIKERIYKKEPNLGDIRKNIESWELLICTAVIVWEEFE